MKTEDAILSEQSDEELMRAYVNGNAQAFSELYARYEGSISSFLFHRVSSDKKAMAADLFQVTWLKVHQNRARFDPNQRFKPWLFTVALNTLRDYSREARHKVEYSNTDEVTRTADQNTSEDKLIIKESLLALEKHLQALPHSQREVLLLSDSEGFTTKEIAPMLNLSEGGVRQLLFRARSKIKTALSEEKSPT